jgi:hypothetical protein
MDALTMCTRRQAGQSALTPMILEDLGAPKPQFAIAIWSIPAA